MLSASMIMHMITRLFRFAEVVRMPHAETITRIQCNLHRRTSSGNMTAVAARRPFIPFLNGQAAGLAATSYSRLRSEADVG
jgi:hypothetical protein